MSQLGDALTDPALDPPVDGDGVLELQPGVDRARPGTVLAGLRREDLFTVRARAVHDRHGAPRRRRAAGHHPARAPRRAVLVGPSLHDLERAGDRAAGRGEAQHGDVPRCSRRAWDSTTRASRETDEAMLASLFADSAPGGVAEGELRERGWMKVDLGQGAAPHAEGGFGTPTEAPAARGLAASTRPAAVLRPAGRGGRRRAGRALPARRWSRRRRTCSSTRRSPTRRASTRAQPQPVRRDPPRRRRGARDRGRRPGAGASTTAARSRARRGSPTTPARAWPWPRWAGGTRDYPGGREQPGDHVAARSPPSGERADVQRQPRGGRAGAVGPAGRRRPSGRAAQRRRRRARLRR